MASTDNKSSAGSSDHLAEDPNAASQNAQDQALLKALQALIVPLVHQTMGRNDIEQIPLGPEAGKLITALKEFISSIVHSRSEEKNTITVNLSEEDIERHASISERQESNDHGREVFIPERIAEKPQPISQEKVFNGLREHVFNKMPIRLLCFEYVGSHLQISLVERSAIHTRIEDAMRKQMGEEELFPRYKPTTSRTYEEHSSVIERLIAKYARYAILSHTWLRTASGEVTYGDWNKERLDDSNAGYRKLGNFCTAAWRDHGVNFGWMDTVCINKDSSSELDESIRSMYKWYERAAVCITYLADTQTLPRMHLDTWFTRGWTLQELVASNVIKFYNRDWNKVLEDAKNDKYDARIQDEIERASTISRNELRYIRFLPISRTMELAAKRQVTREEDTAYSLMGIFNVSIATAYGEGAERAFRRLLREILTTTDKGVLDIFNFASVFVYYDNTRVLPDSPRAYTTRTNEASKAAARIVPTEPLILTHLGLRVSLILMPAILIRNAIGPGIPTHNPAAPVGDFDATTPLFSMDRRELDGTYHLLDEQVTGPNGPHVNGIQAEVSFAVFNFTGDTTATIYISKTCLAWALQSRREDKPTWGTGKSRYMQTYKPITFNLNAKTTKINEVKGNKYYEVKADDLTKHGMQLVSMYL